MNKKNKEKVQMLTSDIRAVLSIMPSKDESTEYVIGFYEAQAEMIDALANRIYIIVGSEDEF